MNDFVARPHGGLPAEPCELSELTWREAQARDAGAVVTAIDDWWPGRHMILGVCPQLFEHLGDTSLIVEAPGELVGYLSQRIPDAAYVHYVGVRPDWRGRGVGREMHRRFAAVVRERSRTCLVAETGAWNSESIAFHTRLGFTLEASDEIVDGLPVHRAVTGLGFDHVRMVLRVEGADG